MKISILVGILATGVILQSAQQQPKACGDRCSTEIRGLKSKYLHGVPVTFAVHNRSDQDVYVNVTVEAQYATLWREVLISVSDTRHPFGKVVKLMVIKAGTSAAISYDPWSGLVKNVHAPNIQRIRVDEYSGSHHEMKQQSWSQPFELIADKEAHSPY